MAYVPVSNTVPQYSASGTALASGYYLKGYATGTTTPLSMATDDTGGTLLAKCLLNTAGYPLSNPADDTSVFIPHFNAKFKLALYTNATDADNDTTANATWVVDAIPITTSDIVPYNQGGTGAVDQTVGAWMRRTVLHPEDFSTATIGDGTTDATAAWNAAFVEAASLGGAYVDMTPGAQYKLDGQVTMDGNGIVVRGNGFLNNNGGFIPAYTAGPQFIIGNNTTITYGQGFENCHFNPASGGPAQKLFELRGAQRFHWLYCSGQNLYSFAQFGHASSANPCYWVYNTFCQWDHDLLM